MTAAIAAVAPTSGAAQPDRHAAERPPNRAPSPSFHEVLSALNPLQYLPVIGTIYRAVTGDTIPEAVRRVGSLVVSALMGGPIGVAVNLATMAAEAVTGIDAEHTAQGLLHGQSIGSAIAANAPASGSTPTPGNTPASGKSVDSSPTDAARRQGGSGQTARSDAAAAPLAISDAASGTTAAASSAAIGPTAAISAVASGAASPSAVLRPGLSITAYAGRLGPLPVGVAATAEVLNTRELARIGAATAAYARVAALAP